MEKVKVFEIQYSTDKPTDLEHQFNDWVIDTAMKYKFFKVISANVTPINHSFLYIVMWDGTLMR